MTTAPAPPAPPGGGVGAVAPAPHFPVCPGGGPFPRLGCPFPWPCSGAGMGGEKTTTPPPEQKGGGARFFPGASGNPEGMNKASSREKKHHLTKREL